MANPMIRPVVVILVFIFSLSILDMGSWADTRLKPRAPHGAFELSCLLLFAGFISVFHSLLRWTTRGALSRFLAEVHHFLPDSVPVNFRRAARGIIEGGADLAVIFRSAAKPQPSYHG